MLGDHVKKTVAQIKVEKKNQQIEEKTIVTDDFEEMIASIDLSLPAHKKLEIVEKKIFPLLAKWENKEKEVLFIKGELREKLKIKTAGDFKDRYLKLRPSLLVKLEVEEDPKGHMTSEERQEALDYLKDPMLIQNIVKDIDTCGYKKDDEKKVIQYLAATSRKLAKPIDTIIKSPSSSGKSYLVEVIQDMMPPEEVMVIGGASAKALQYMDEDALVGKWVVFLEVEGMWELQSNLRLIQDGGFDYHYTAKDEKTGEFRTIKKKIDGPLALTTTTTRANINDENETRMWELSIDTSEEKIQSAHKAHAATTTLLHLEETKPKIERIQKLHKNVQRLLESILVVNESNPLIRFPTTTLRSQRDRKRFSSLIEVVAFIRQNQKERKYSDTLSRDYIEVDLEDYAIAYELSKAVLGSCTDTLPQKAKEVFEMIKKRVIKELGENLSTEELKNYSFSVQDVVKWSRLPKTSVARYLDALEDEEYLGIEGEQKKVGKRTMYYLRQMNEVSQSYLDQVTTPEQLRKLVEQKFPTSPNLPKQGEEVNNSMYKPKTEPPHQAVPTP